MAGKKWVLLVAGSKGWENYRHQANVCCFYQLIKNYGIPDQQIVVMMYDDIAGNPQNPEMGNIISVIQDIPNVYPGVPKDYTKEDVTPKNFLAALKGEIIPERKIIKSESTDEIFIYMSGLGEQGTFDFPDQKLSASELTEAINHMYGEKKFSKLVIYMDSYYSATMFKDLSQYKNVYAVTSCDEQNKNIPIDPDSKRNVYLSDQFSSALLNYFNMKNSIATQLKSLNDFLFKSATTNPCQYGDKNVSSCKLSDFLQK